MLSRLIKLFQKRDISGFRHGWFPTRRARKIVSSVNRIAKEMGADKVQPKHLLLAFMYDKGSIAYCALSSVGITRGHLAQLMHERKGVGQEIPSISLIQVYEQSATEAQRLGNTFIGTEHLLLALMAQPDPEILSILEHFQTTPSAVVAQVEGILKEAASQKPVS